MTSVEQLKPMLAAVRGKQQKRPPIWIMRQAGRYLPEYRIIRLKAKGFLDLCYNPDLATEVTLQPLKRFNLDAAILFSDILVIPDALGQQVRFEEGIGPVLNPISQDDIEKLDVDRVLGHLSCVLETVGRVREALDDTKTLIGFCGSPWTVATYMIGGRGSPDQAVTRLFALQFPDVFDRLIDKLVEASICYLVAQLHAGADVVQLFESWALNLDEDMFAKVVVEPNKRIVAGVRAQISDAAIIGFPRGAGGLLSGYLKETKVNALGLDYALPIDFANKLFPSDIPVQGNLDPLRLVIGGDQMIARAEKIIEGFSNRPHIFNLGHGIVPQTPVAHVEQLIRYVKG